MITEDYVGFETAKLLKEKGFNKDAYTMYMYDKNGEVTSWGIVGPPGEAGDSGD